MLASASALAACGAARVPRIGMYAAATSSPVRVIPRGHRRRVCGTKSNLAFPRSDGLSQVSVPSICVVQRRHSTVVPRAFAGVTSSPIGVLELVTLVAKSLIAAIAAALTAYVLFAAKQKAFVPEYFRPRINPPASKRMAALLAATPALHRAMDPPFFLHTSAAQLLFYLLKQKLDEKAQFERDTIELPDGGEIAIDWHVPETFKNSKNKNQKPLPNDAPVVCVMHTLTGTSDDFATFTHEAYSRGFRVAVLLRRGHLGNLLKTPKFNLLGSCEDLDVHLKFVKSKFPECEKIFGYAESAGTGLAVRYAGEKNDQCEFDAMTMVCPGYDTTEGAAFSRFEPVLDTHLLKSVKKMFLLGENEKVFTNRKKEKETDDHPSYHDLLATKTMADFQRLSYAMEGYDSLDEYHENTNPMGAVLGISTPTLVINADDDPVCAPSNVNDNMYCFHGECLRALVRTNIGTHCCFYEGKWLRPEKSWAHDAALGFFQAVQREMK